MKNGGDGLVGASELMGCSPSTGSSKVGRLIGTEAAKSFKHCSLELGGKNPMIVLDDANLDLAIEGGLWGAFGTTGTIARAPTATLTPSFMSLNVSTGIFHYLYIDRWALKIRGINR